MQTKKESIKLRKPPPFLETWAIGNMRRWYGQKKNTAHFSTRDENPKKYQKTQYSSRSNSRDKNNSTRYEDNQEEIKDDESRGVYFDGELCLDNSYFDQNVNRQRTQSAPMPEEFQDPFHENYSGDFGKDLGSFCLEKELDFPEPSTPTSGLSSSPSTPSTISETSLDHPLSAESTTDWGWFVDSNGSQNQSGELKFSTAKVKEMVTRQQQEEKKQIQQQQKSQEDAMVKLSPAEKAMELSQFMSRMSFLDLAALGKGDESSAVKRQGPGRFRSCSMQPPAPLSFSNTI